MSGGTNAGGYPLGAAFFRNSVAKTYDEQIQRLADQLEENMVRSQKSSIESSLNSQNAKNEQIFSKQERLIERLRESKSLGRVAINFPNDLTNLQGESYNLVLEAGDRLHLPSIPSTINVIGQVHNPNTLAYNADWTVKDYLASAGGMTKSADVKNVYVIKANGMITPINNRAPKRRFGWLTGKNENRGLVKMGPGDTVLVPEDFEIKPNRLQVTRDVTQIMFQIISSLGVIVAAF
jgi:hypothetical protein